MSRLSRRICFCSLLFHLNSFNNCWKRHQIGKRVKMKWRGDMTCHSLSLFYPWGSETEISKWFTRTFKYYAVSLASQSKVVWNSCLETLKSWGGKEIQVILQQDLTSYEKSLTLNPSLHLMSHERMRPKVKVNQAHLQLTCLSPLRVSCMMWSDSCWSFNFLQGKTKFCGIIWVVQTDERQRSPVDHDFFRESGQRRLSCEPMKDNSGIDYVITLRDKHKYTY
jgi:hypothetical protein